MCVFQRFISTPLTFASDTGWVLCKDKHCIFRGRPDGQQIVCNMRPSAGNGDPQQREGGIRKYCMSTQVALHRPSLRWLADIAAMHCVWAQAPRSASPCHGASHG